MEAHDIEYNTTDETVGGEPAAAESHSQSFTVFVTITDGTDPNGDTTENTGYPDLFVTGFASPEGGVTGGAEFAAVVSVKNIGTAAAVHIKVTYGSESEGIATQSALHTFQVEDVPAGETVDIELPLLRGLSAEAGEAVSPHNIAACRQPNLYLCFCSRRATSGRETIIAALGQNS